MTECPLTDDARRYLDHAREQISLDTSRWEGDSLAAVLNRALLNDIVAAEQRAIDEAFAGTFDGLNLRGLQ